MGARSKHDMAKQVSRTKGRLRSVDMARGLTVAVMILVNNGHSGQFELLRHARWNGLTICDLVFPSFLFIMGVSIALSMRRSGGQFSPAAMGKVAKRTILLLLIGLAINWLDKAIGGHVLCWQELRFWGVLQRIAVCYLFAALLAMSGLRRYPVYTAIALLCIYTIIICFGRGYSEDAALNLLAKADRALFGYEHLYHKSTVDPEGLVGSISALATTLFGYALGRVFCKQLSVKRKAQDTLIYGVLLLAAGYLVSVWLPFNKRIWSPSFALATSGYCALLIAVCIYIADLKHDGKAALAGKRYGGFVTFCEVFGVNALALYIASEVIAIVFGAMGISDALFGFWTSVFCIADHAGATPWVSLAYAATFLGINFAVGYILWRRRIFIKI